jgi:hypothetical protein
MPEINLPELKTRDMCKPDFDALSSGSACECCGKSLASDKGALAVLVFAVVECHGKEYKVCHDCEKVVKWICEKQREGKKGKP